MSKNKVIKSVSFNKTNEQDQMILNKIKRRNFSGYVKKLIVADIKSKERENPQNWPIKEVRKEVEQEEVIEDRRERLKRRQEQLKKAGNNPTPDPFIPNQRKS